ncbi:MAG: methyltransferase, partial [Erysipelotrichaceae bacterium]|nr:methyltransferase [Erysipelotrichaceae bacterium]
MEHYFTNNPQKKENRKEISFRFLTHLETFVSDGGVFSKDTLDFGSRLLLQTLVSRTVSGRILDLGCGIGYIGIMLKKHFPEIELTMSDVNEAAVSLAEEN